MRISVTREDTLSISRQSSTCMVAMAIRRAFPSARHISVGFITADVDGVCYRLPEPVADRIDAFLYGRPVEPFEFDMERM